MIRNLWILTVVVALASGCTKRETNDATADASIGGTIALSGSQTSTAAMQLEISLTDVSVDDGSLEIAKRLVQAPERFPAEYDLPYRSSAIQPAHRYMMSARLLESGRPLWATDTAYPVITQGNPKRIDIRLVKVGENSSGEAPAGTIGAIDGATVEAELHDRTGLVTYRAYFQGTQLMRLDEIRGPRRASYEFTGARLRRYESSREGLQEHMEFDDRGKLLRSTRRTNWVSAAARSEDVDAVRNRAELLRSHALAQKDIQAHTAAH